MSLTFPISVARLAGDARPGRRLLVVAALVLVAHGLALAPVPWPQRSTLPAWQREDRPASPALQWVTVQPATRAPAAAMPVVPAVVPPSAPPSALPPRRAGAPATARAPVTPLATARNEPAAATPSPPAALAPAGTASLFLPSLPPGAIGTPPPVAGAGAVQDNVARSIQRGGAAFARAASDAVATPAQRLAAGIAGAAPETVLSEAQAGTSRTARVRGALGSYCVRTKDPSLKLDAFRQELAVPTNCPP